MAIRLDTVDLNPNLIWVEQYRSQSVRQTGIRTLDGVYYSSASKVSGGMNITLEATEEQGWRNMYYSTVIVPLMELAAVPDAIYTLLLGNNTYRVKFRHEDAPSVDLTPFIRRIVQEPFDVFYGQIKLVTTTN